MCKFCVMDNTYCYGTYGIVPITPVTKQTKEYDLSIFCYLQLEKRTCTVVI